MNKMIKGFTLGLLLVLIALIPACRTGRTRRVATPTTATTATVPEVAPTAPRETRVETPPVDFVAEDPRPVAEELPRDIEQLNRVAHDRGFLRDAFFSYDEAGLTTDAQASLSASASWLQRNPQYNLLIEGHCDERGTEQYNLALGDRRANTARDYLVTLGIAPSRIRTVSYGEERPFQAGSDESAFRLNRRAHLVLVRSGS